MTAILRHHLSGDHRPQERCSARKADGGRTEEDLQPAHHTRDRSFQNTGRYLDGERHGYQYGLLLVLRTGKHNPADGYVESFELYTRGQMEPDSSWLTT